MEKPYGKITITRYTKKPNTKTVWQEIESTTKEITEEYYLNTVNATPLMRHLGGTERQEKSYTKRGFKVTHITSISPDKQNKTVRIFNLDY